jgi:CheY-like chemotaxis protein
LLVSAPQDSRGGYEAGTTFVVFGSPALCQQRFLDLGLAALAILNEPGIDLGLLDLDLPGIDGLQLARLLRVRERDSDRHLPLIAITARSHGNEEAQSRQAGMDGFLRKPLSADQLEKAMAPWLGGGRPGSN